MERGPAGTTPQPRSAEWENESVRVRYYYDPRSRQPHIYGHNVGEDEVEAVLDRPMEDRPGAGGVRIALGQTQAGRYLRVV